MIGVILLLIVFYWFLIGDRHTRNTKILISLIILGFWILWLYSQGATPEKIFDVMLNF